MEEKETIIAIPDTIGGIIEMLTKYPADAKVSVYAAVVYDNGSVYDEERYRVGVTTYDHGEDVVKDVIFSLKTY